MTTVTSALLGRRREQDDSLGAGRQVPLGLGAGASDVRRLEDDVDAEAFQSGTGGWSLPERTGICRPAT